MKNAFSFAMGFLVMTLVSASAYLYFDPNSKNDLASVNDTLVADTSSIDTTLLENSSTTPIIATTSTTTLLQASSSSTSINN